MKLLVVQQTLHHYLVAVPQYRHAELVVTLQVLVILKQPVISGARVSRLLPAPHTNLVFTMQQMVVADQAIIPTMPQCCIILPNRLQGLQHFQHSVLQEFPLSPM